MGFAGSGPEHSSASGCLRCVSGSAAEGSQQEESVTGTINRLDTDYLVLITDDGEYQVMDFGENFSVEGFSEGDDVVITYTGTLENEEKPPVITAMEAAQ